MQQIEITTRVLEDRENVVQKLLQLGFIQRQTGYIDDLYLCPNLEGLTINNIPQFLKQCVLIRYIDNGNKTFQKLTYKNKIFQDGVTISEEKINVCIDDVQKAKSLFLVLNFQELVRVKYDYWVFEKDGVELALQNVEGLGLLLEYEHLKDFTGKDFNLIIKTKQEMLNSVKNLGIKISDEYDVKKAYELIVNKLMTV